MKKKSKKESDTEQFTPVHHWNYMQNSGLIEEFEKAGISVRPTHNYELLKLEQAEKWNQYFNSQKKEYEFAGNKITESYEVKMKMIFLNKEIFIFEEFLKRTENDNERMIIEKYIKDCQREIQQFSIDKNFNQTSSNVLCLLGELLPTELIEYLNEQLAMDREKNPGKELDFLFYILDIIEIQRSSGFLPESRIKFIHEWIEQKKKELEPGETNKQGEEQLYEEFKKELSNQMTAIDNALLKIESISEKKIYLQKILREHERLRILETGKPLSFDNANPFPSLLINKIKSLEEEEDFQGERKKELKKIKSNPSNQPSLNQVQISILFRLFKDSNVFTNKDLDKKGFAKIISQLTGYSENTIRINFSASELIQISDKPQDYDKIKTELLAIIEKLEREKGKIS